MRRPLRRGILRWVRRGLAAVVALLLLAVAGGWLWLRTSLPQLDGTIALPGLSAPVSVTRDEHGIPYIRAGSERDAQFMLGFLHAQDRLAQLEMTRRIGAGRLAELVGASALPFDRTIRTMGLPGLAEGDLETLPPAVRAVLDAYAAGVNAFLATHRGALPPEFYLLWHRPEPWAPVDSLRWGRLMALRLAGNWDTELLRARLARHLPPERIAALWPPYPADAPVSIDGLPGERRAGDAQPVPFADDAGRPEPAPELRLDEWLRGGRNDGSNAWVLAGSRTTTGKPILANDPHLGFVVPNHWYLVRIDTPGGTLAGATAPGVPFLILGHNDRLAWGLTTTHGDAADLFVERLDPADPSRYLTPEGSRPIETRTETIRVRGADPVTITVRRTRHGPVISDANADAAAIAPPGHVVALAHTALLPGDLNTVALYGVNRAENIGAFQAALRSFRAPQQNVMAADSDGRIALEMPALIPVRRSGDGRMPVAGWDGAADWTGFAAHEQRPYSVDPARGWIVNANNKLVPDDWPVTVATDWPAPYRAQRIATVLGETVPQTPEDSARLALDTMSLGAAAALPVLLTAEIRSDRDRRAADMLRQWDRRMDRGRPEPLIYAAWMREATRALFEDDLGADFSPWWSDRPDLIGLAATDASWCDDTATGERETCPRQFAAALDAALDMLERRFGPDPSSWRWGAAHAARFDNMPFSRLPVVGDWFTLRIGSDGGNYTVNHGGFASRGKEPSFENVHGAGFRAVYDLADLDRSLFIQAVGQSGNLFSPYFSDLMALWRDGRSLRLVPPERPAHRLRLEPAEEAR